MVPESIKNRYLQRIGTGTNVGRATRSVLALVTADL